MWNEKDQQYIWHPYTHLKHSDPPLFIARGKGSYLYDEQGRAYLDAVSSWWVNLHGHAHPYIAKQVAAQLHELEHVIFAGFTHAPAIELAERLLMLLPDNQQKVFFSDNGSTAVEVALKMALQHWYNRGVKRHKVIAFEQGYHGDTFGAMSVSGRSAFTTPFDDLLFEVHHIPVPVAGQERAALDALQRCLSQGDTAAFIFEPLLLGAAGMRTYAPEVLDNMLAACREANVLTIADEVLTGFCRTGKYWATAHCRHEPDLFCLSKGLTGGTMAMGVTTCTQAVMAPFIAAEAEKTFFHGHSYTGNPLACRAAWASLDLLERPDTQTSVRRITRQQQAFAKKIQRHRHVRNVRQLGTLLAFDVNTGASSSYFDDVRDELYRYFLRNGVILRPLGNVVYVLPPYCMTKSELQQVHEVITTALDEPGLCNK